MRTTISIDDNLYQQIKHAAIDRKMSLSKFMEQAARSFVKKTAETKAQKKKYTLPVFGSKKSGFAKEFAKDIDINKISEVLFFLEKENIEKGKYV